ncbi:MAG: formate--tetrahydrofolate ligase [Planctomycetales bacterium]|nr:formate--tetrahydrofolate ligase [Planctomycetales bacterium]
MAAPSGGGAGGAREGGPGALPVKRVASALGIRPDELELHGPDVAKVRTEILRRIGKRPLGTYVVVTAMTPTPFGEGKTVTTIGLGQGLAATGRSAVVTLRQPSLGPLFGTKGGGTGGGRAEVVPRDRVNLHLTGDLHAVAAAHNLLAALADDACARGRHDLAPEGLTIRRALDVNDKALRRIRIGLEDGSAPRETGFEATAASEVMAILALAEGTADLRARLSRIEVGRSRAGAPVTAGDLGAAGAMAALLRDAVKPNLLQTREGTPVLVHAGPFANIAHGNSSVIADRIALRLADWVVTEAGFGADMGAEKFFNVKCRAAGLRPAAAVVVATVRALKAHGLGAPLRSGAKLPGALDRPDPALVERGAPNLAKQVENVLLHGVPVVASVNRFPGDTEDEVRAALAAARAAGAAEAVVSEAFARGGEGARDLADAVVAVAGRGPGYHPLYPLEAPLREKIAAVATRVYGASGVEFSPGARASLEALEGGPTARLPVCMAKTQFSLSHDPKLPGRPSGFALPVAALRPAYGAGFVVALCGEISTMPGMPGEPRARHVDVTDEGEIVGL